MLHENEIENEDTVYGVFPQARQDEMEQHARQFAAIAWAAQNGDNTGLARQRADAALEIARHTDAGTETVYIARQLEFIRKALYEIKYTALKSPQLVSYNTTIPRGAQNRTVKAIDTAGEPSIERDDNDDIPSVEMSVVSGTAGFFNMNLKYSFTDQDAAEAMFSGMPLPTMKATAVRTAMARKADIIAFYGEPISGAKGILNQANTLTYSVPTTGQNGATTLASKDSDAILLDLNAPGDQVITSTNEIEEPDTWLMPLDAYRFIGTKRVGDGTSDTVLSYFQRTRQASMAGKLTVVATTKSLAANYASFGGSSGKSRMMVYKNDKEHLEFQLPVPFYQGAPQYRGFRTTTHCMMRCGGVDLYLPKSVIYADGLS